MLSINLQDSSESCVPTAVQLQEVSHLSEMVDTPESLRLAAGIGALEPRQSKGTFLERPIGVAHQKRLDVRLAHLWNVLDHRLRRTISPRL